MNKRGAALIFGLLVLLVLAALFSAFFLKTINENNLVRRYIGSLRAFWAAEAGIAEAKRNLPNNVSGAMDLSRFQATTAFRTSIDSRNYYDIQSTGIVDFSPAATITRILDAVVRTGSVDVSRFPYAIDAANDLCFGGSQCNKAPEGFMDPDVCDGHACWQEGDTSINFRDLFGYEQSDIQGMATRYTDSNFPGNVSGISWVDVAAGSTLSVAGNLTGTGLLIVNGNVRFEGDYTFRGIIYVLGTMTARGNFDAWGSVIVASTAGIDSINGSPEFHWSQVDVGDALSELSFLSAETVSWSEGQ